MQRDLERLANQTFDVVVIGGGIYGACVCYEASRRGLSVALIEQGDFGHATSANSLKVIHGGFRYLQQGDVPRIRESVCERRVLLRAAPHLVRPMPVLVPTYRSGLEQRTVMRCALAAYDLLSWDRNRGVTDLSRRTPAGHMVSRDECLQLAPGLAGGRGIDGVTGGAIGGLTGGAVWYDAQALNTERLTLAWIRTAVEQHGAAVANYVKADGAIMDGRDSRRVTGVTAVDVLSGRSFELRGRFVVNTGGPWLTGVSDWFKGRSRAQRVVLSKSWNVVTRAITTTHAVSVSTRPSDGRAPSSRNRRLFLTPWRGKTLVGTLYAPHDGPPDACRVTDGEVAALLDVLKASYPGMPLTCDDVSFTHVGLLPRDPQAPDPEHVFRHYRLIDHAAEDGVTGALSIIGVKYTTARDVAERAVMLVCRRLGMPRVGRLPVTAPLHGGAFGDWESFRRGVVDGRSHGLAQEVLEQLAEDYGTEWRAVTGLIDRDVSLAARLGASDVIAAQVAYAVDEEMAQTLADVVLRRTPLGTAGHPGADALTACADVMVARLGWDDARRRQEIDAVEEVYRIHER